MLRVARRMLSSLSWRSPQASPTFVSINHFNPVDSLDSSRSCKSIDLPDSSRSWRSPLESPAFVPINHSNSIESSDSSRSWRSPQAFLAFVPLTISIPLIHRIPPDRRSYHHLQNPLLLPPLSINYEPTPTRFSSESLPPTNEMGLDHDLLTTVEAIKNPSSKIVYDEHNLERYPPGDPSKRAFAYFVLTGGRFMYASLIRLLVLKFVLSMSASKDVLALSSLEVDLSSIELGKTVTVKWCGKPVFIRRRTEVDIKLAKNIDIGSFRDPQDDVARVKNPEWLVVIGVYTHLGCIPLPNAGDYGGWFCPCHGSHYDIIGRIRKGLAPYNLEVPTYMFLEENKLLVR